MPFFLGPLFVDAVEPTDAAPGSVWLDSASAPTFAKIKNEDGNWDDLSAGALASVATHLADTEDAHDASAISFAPAGTIAATNVQDAIEEVASEATASEPYETEVLETAKTSNYPVTAPDSGTTFTNEGASGEITFTLQVATSPGAVYHFVVTDAQYLRIDVDTGNAFYLGGTVTAGATKYVRSNTIGSTATYVHVDGVWFARAYTGTWEVSS